MLSADVDRYIVYLRQAGRSPRTCFLYDWHLQRLVTWLSDRGVGAAPAVTRDLLRAWSASLRDRWLESTIKPAVVATRGLFAWLTEEGDLVTDPGLALDLPRPQERAQRTITMGELRLMLAACDLSVKGLRDRALINVLIDTGLRSFEVCGLKADGLDVKAGTCVAKVKGGQLQLRFYGQTTAVSLLAWLAVRPGASDYLFVAIGGSYPGRQLTTAGLRTILRKVGEAAGVARVTTHAFRRGFACIASQNGAPSRLVQLAGGWSDIRMVERYTRALGGRELYGQWSPADAVNGDGC